MRHPQLHPAILYCLSVQRPPGLVLCSSSLPRLEEVQPPLQDMPRRRLSQLLEELLTDLGEKHMDLVFIFLLMKASIVEDDELSCPGKCRHMTVKMSRLFL